MKKEEIIKKIAERLSNGSEIVVSEMGFRNGRWGLHGYCLCLMQGEVYVRPWAGANVYWRANLEGLKKEKLLQILNK